MDPNGIQPTRGRSTVPDTRSTAETKDRSGSPTEMKFGNGPGGFGMTRRRRRRGEGKTRTKTSVEVVR